MGWGVEGKSGKQSECSCGRVKEMTWEKQKRCGGGWGEWSATGLK